MPSIAFTADVRCVSSVVAQEVCAVLGGGGGLTLDADEAPERSTLHDAELSIEVPAVQDPISSTVNTSGWRENLPPDTLQLLAAVKGHPVYATLRDQLQTELPECGEARIDQIANAVCDIIMDVCRATN